MSPSIIIVTVKTIIIKFGEIGIFKNLGTSYDVNSKNLCKLCVFRILFIFVTG